MKKIDLGQSITILANLGVIAGIVFLGIELRQNNELMEAEARFNRVSIATRTSTIMAENPDLADLFVRANNNEELTAGEESRLRNFSYRVYTNMEWTFRETPEDVPLITWQRIVATPFYRKYWELRKTEFDPAFVQFMDENIVNR